MQHDVLHSDGTIEIGMARSTVRLAGSRDRLLPRLMVSSERKTELAPYRNQASANCRIRRSLCAGVGVIRNRSELSVLLGKLSPSFVDHSACFGGEPCGNGVALRTKPMPRTLRIMWVSCDPSTLRRSRPI